MASLEQFNSDILDDDFVKIFKPLHCVQTLMGTIRVRFQRKYVSGTSLFQRIYSSALAALALPFTYYVFVAFQAFPRFYIVSCLQFLNFNIVYLLNVASNAFCRRDKNPQIYLLLQNIDRILATPSKTQLNKRQFKLNCTFSVATIALCLLFTSYQFLDSDWVYTVSMYYFSIFCITSVDFEILNFQAILHFIRKRIQYINTEMEDYISKKNDRKREKCIEIKVKSKSKQPNIGDFYKAYLQISRVFNLSKQCYQLCLLGATTAVFFNLLLIVEVFILLAKDVSLFSTLIPAWFAVLLILRVSIIGLSCESFSSQIKKTREICQKYYSCDDPLVRRHTKNIVRICEIRLEEPIICGVFRADARLPLRLLALTTTYTVVLLQFAYNQDGSSLVTPTFATTYNETTITLL